VRVVVVWEVEVVVVVAAVAVAVGGLLKSRRPV